MNYKRFLISDAVHYNRVVTDTFKISYLTVNFILPLSSETLTRSILLQRVLKRGCRSYPTRQLICRRLEELYSADISASVSRKGDTVVVSFALDMLDSSYVPEGSDIARAAVDLLFDLIFEPLLQPDGLLNTAYVASEKANMLDRIRSVINRKARYALQRYSSFMYGDDPFGLPVFGTEEELAAVTDSGLIGAYNAMLSGAAVEVFYVGGDDALPIEKLLRQRFSGIRRHPVPLPETRVLKAAAHEPRELTETVEAIQGNLVMGYRTDGIIRTSPDYPALVVFNEVFGGSATSKLFMNVREKKSLCYSCYSALESRKGVITVYAGIENGCRDAAVREIKAQLSAMASGEITSAELLCAKQSIRASCMSVADSPSVIEGYCMNRLLAGIPIRDPNEEIAAYDAVTVADLQRIAERISLDTVYFLRGDSEEEDADVEEDSDE